MVVVWQSALAVFWLEYRRFLRTRRYWALTLGMLITGWVLSTLMGAAANSVLVKALLPLAHSAGFVMALLVGLTLMVSSPLVKRMLEETYKTRPLLDLYLTELHPLGVVLGRVGAVVALGGIALLLQTPLGLWWLALFGMPLPMWGVVVLLAWVSLAVLASWDAVSRRLQVLNAFEGTAQPLTVGGSGVFVLTFLPIGVLLVGMSLAFAPRAEGLLWLPGWAFSPLTAPLLALSGNALVIATGVASAFAVVGVLALAAAQWREWWSQRTYDWLRVGGTVVWVTLVGVHAGLVAHAFVVSRVHAERTLLTTLLAASFLNLLVASVLGYYGMARRPKTHRYALPYPLGGIVWQWGLHWLTALAVYLGVGVGGGLWVSTSLWASWTTYAWLAMVVLPQALSTRYWVIRWYHPTPLQGDYYADYYINTRVLRAWLERGAELTQRGWRALLILWSIALIAHLVLFIVHRQVGGSFLLVGADWVQKLHPWWAFGFGWNGAPISREYFAYTAVLVLIVGAVGWQQGVREAAEVLENYRQWQARRSAEREAMPVVTAAYADDPHNAS